MKGLLVKDFGYFGLNKKLYAVVFIVIIAALLMGNTETVDFFISFSTSFLAVMLGMQVMASITYDEYDGGMAYIMTMPVSRRQYVYSKYIYMGILTSLGAVMGCIIGVILGMGRNVPIELNDVAVVVITVIGFISVFNSIMIPLQLKFGADKGKMALFVIVAIILLIAFASEKITKALGINLPEILEKADIYIANMNKLVIGVSGAGIVAVLIGISVVISIAIVNKKEF